MRLFAFCTVLGSFLLIAPVAALAQPLPFSYKAETFREKDTDVLVFALQLEQPFLAEEFEKSNYLRLESLDRNSYLIYPRETKFQNKHAEFYGRLRGQGKAKLRLSYEIVSENLDGSRKVDVRHADIEVGIPAEPSEPAEIHKAWARQQNAHFANLLSYYPDESFFEYVLLQSRERYGVSPPKLRKPAPSNSGTEEDLYYLFSGGLSMQQSLQRQTLAQGTQIGDLNVHISRVAPPSLRSLDYETLLKKKLEAGAKTAVPDISKLVPIDQYFLHVNSMKTAVDLMDLSVQWGEGLLRLFTVNARDHHLREKYENQLCLKIDGLTKLFADGAISELAVTGSDFFIAEGTDVTIILGLKDPIAFQQTAAQWLAGVKAKHPDVSVREFNYRGHKVAARYTTDRMVSSFVVIKDRYAVYSNSHVAVRRIVDTMIGAAPNLHDATDYRYASTILPPSADPQCAYLYCSETFLKRLLSPAFKIGEKRRLQSFNNLVMLNNASLFYRLENGRSPTSLTDLVGGRFVNAQKVVCPHGGVYGFDVERDTCTSSLYNRIKYLTPLVELDVLKISDQEQKEYDRYKKRYEAFWKQAFNPLAVRITVGATVKLETCFPPFANGNLDDKLRAWLDDRPQPIGVANIAKSAVLSFGAVPGREKVGQFLREIPGATEALEADPTLTDLSWLGDRVSVHFCDDDTILEVDPTRLRPLKLFLDLPVSQQILIGMAVNATNLPIYFTLGVEDEDKAARLLENLTSRIFLKSGSLADLPTALDAYRLPEYKKRPVYVLSYQLYALKIRLYVALVDGQLAAATKPYVLHEVIDAAEAPESREPREAHALFRLNVKAMRKVKDDLRTHWAEKARLASHRNIMPIYNLIKLYDVPIQEVNKLSDAKYGVTYFCPDGEYSYDAERDQVVSTVYGNRQRATQNLPSDGNSSFSRFADSLDEVVTSLRFTDDGLMATIELIRRED